MFQTQKKRKGNVNYVPYSKSKWKKNKLHHLSSFIQGSGCLVSFICPGSLKKKRREHDGEVAHMLCQIYHYHLIVSKIVSQKKNVAIIGRYFTPVLKIRSLVSDKSPKLWLIYNNITAKINSCGSIKK